MCIKKSLRIQLKNELIQILSSVCTLMYILIIHSYVPMKKQLVLHLKLEDTPLSDM